MVMIVVTIGNLNNKNNNLMSKWKCLEKNVIGRRN